MRTRPLIVYGPPGSGKTLNAKMIAAAFGCLGIVDGWDGREPLKPGVLALTNLSIDQIDRNGCDLYPIDRAILEAKRRRIM